MIRTQLGILYGQGFPFFFAEYTDLVTLTPADIQTLNTVPISILPAPGANKIIVPKDIVVAVKAGTVNFSGTVTPHLKIPASAASFDLTLTNGAFNGSATIVRPFTVVNADYKANYAANGGINAALFLDSAANVTGGTGATLSLIITYQIIDLTGLI